MQISELEPKKVFRFFEEISAIPHGSGNTKGLEQYCLDFAKERGIESFQDEYGNIVLFKPASSGYEDHEPVILQGHLDMVCEKDADCNIDMEKDAIKLATDGTLLWAEGTTLGADDGIALAYALVMDSICATLYVMFLLWAIGHSEKFNKWTKADTTTIDEVGRALEEEAKANTKPLTWQNIAILIASRADLSAMGNAPMWLLSGLVILIIHVTIMILLAKLLKIDLFTSCVASLANIGGTATAPVLAGTYSSALVPVGIIMALLGYVIGTGGGLVVAKLMSFFG